LDRSLRCRASHDTCAGAAQSNGAERGDGGQVRRELQQRAAGRSLSPAARRSSAEHRPTPRTPAIGSIRHSSTPLGAATCAPKGGGKAAHSNKKDSHKRGSKTGCLVSKASAGGRVKGCHAAARGLLSSRRGKSLKKEEEEGPARGVGLWSIDRFFAGSGGGERTKSPLPPLLIAAAAPNLHTSTPTSTSTSTSRAPPIKQTRRQGQPPAFRRHTPSSLL